MNLTTTSHSFTIIKTKAWYRSKIEIGQNYSNLQKAVIVNENKCEFHRGTGTKSSIIASAGLIAGLSFENVEALRLSIRMQNAF